MRIYVNKYPTANDPCPFFNKQNKTCRIGDEWCDIMTCPYLEVLEQPVKDDCK